MLARARMSEQTFPLDLEPAPGEKLDGDWVLTQFLAYVEQLGLELYPAQEEAILEISQGNNVILNTPTGSGKSLVAMAACFAALSYGERAYYTAPIKALVSERFLQLARVFGPHNVGMMTGDATVNRGAPVICCTAEILSNLALREGSNADLEWVVMDEFHYYSDRDRGVAWQVPLLTLPQARFLLMSATLGDTQFFEQELTQRTGVPTKLVKSTDRPVPLDFAYVETPLHETIASLLEQARAPIYIVHFSQRAASEQAQKLTSLDFLDKAQKQQLKDELRGTRFDSPFGKELMRFLPHGIGVHHAGMLPKYRLMVERLAQKGLLKVICGTDTLGVGVNIPLRTVLFTQLCKYDGDKVKLLNVRDFHQIAGRAGRRGFDTQGSVVIQAPEHEIENLVAKRKAASDPKKLRKFRPKKEPEFGYAPWDKQTLDKLQMATPEALRSRFTVSAGMVLNVLSRREQDGCSALKRLIRESHETKQKKRSHGRTALSVLRALVDAQIIELRRSGLRISADLADDFSLNQALGLYVVQVLESLDKQERNYALVALSVVEAILENPGAILKQQVETLKRRKLLELKHAGVEYEERVAELEKVDYPKPEKEFLWATFEVFQKAHPWILGNSIAPKSVARDMYELGLSFNAYVKEYGLQRAEGVLLRYLSEAYRVLNHTVVDSAKTEELLDIIDWLRGELEAADASLIEEWQRLSNPEHFLAALSEKDQTSEPEDITSDQRTFLVLLRNEIWRIVVALSRRDFQRGYETLVAQGGLDPAWDTSKLEEALRPYFEEYEFMRIDPVARHPRHLVVDKSHETWVLRQSLVDPEEDLGWALEFVADLPKSRERGAPVLRLQSVLAG